MNITPLIPDLVAIERCLRKYDFHHQADIISTLITAISNQTADHIAMLHSIGIWGGSGAVWEVGPFYTKNGHISSEDTIAFEKAFIALVGKMNRLKIANDRELFVATTFEKWIEDDVWN